MNRTWQFLGLLLIAVLAIGFPSAPTTALADTGSVEHPCLDLNEYCSLCLTEEGCLVMLCFFSGGHVIGDIISCPPGVE